MSPWLWVVIIAVVALLGYDMYRNRYTLFTAFDWGKNQGKQLRKQNYKNTKKQ